MTLNARELKEIARNHGISTKGLERLLSDTRVVIKEKQQLDPDELIKPGVEPEVRETRYLLGLNLMRNAVSAGVPRSALKAVAETAVQEYIHSCPQVTAWLVRGDFNPLEIPESLQRGKIIHACRTAGRIRASCLRKFH